MTSPPLPRPPSELAVVCVECQNGVLGPDSVLPMLAADLGDLVKNLKRLLATARAAGVPVVHATYNGALGCEQSGTARLWKALTPRTMDWVPDSLPTRPLAELSAPTDLVIPRQHGLFPTLDTELLPVLRNLGVKTLILTGVSVNLALPFTAGHASQSGFRVVIPREAVGGSPASYVNDVCDNTMAMLGKVVALDDLIASLTSGDMRYSAR